MSKVLNLKLKLVTCIPYLKNPETSAMRFELLIRITTLQHNQIKLRLKSNYVTPPVIFSKSYNMSFVLLCNRHGKCLCDADKGTTWHDSTATVRTESHWCFIIQMLLLSYCMPAAASLTERYHTNSDWTNGSRLYC